jgi:shikimate kinase
MSNSLSFSPFRGISLIGLSGSGKTSCGKLLAQVLNWQFIDTDVLIEEQESRSINEIFYQSGEAYFRQLESMVLTNLVDSDTNNNFTIFSDKDSANSNARFVLSTGGGLPLLSSNWDLLKQIGPTVLLKADLDCLTQRLIDCHDRPLLHIVKNEDDNNQAGINEIIYRSNLKERLEKLWAERELCYSRARFQIDTSNLKPQQVVEQIIEILCV